MHDDETQAAMEALQHILGKLKSYRGMSPKQEASAPAEDGEEMIEEAVEQEEECAPVEAEIEVKAEDPDAGFMRLVEHHRPGMRKQEESSEEMPAKRGRGRPRKSY
jgi:hypothetical protein